MALISVPTNIDHNNFECSRVALLGHTSTLRVVGKRIDIHWKIIFLIVWNCFVSGMTFVQICIHMKSCRQNVARLTIFYVLQMFSRFLQRSIL